MKTTLRSIFLLALTFSLVQFLPAQQLLNLGGKNDEETESDLTLIQFEKSEYDLGDVQAGDLAKGTFKFTNIGDAPLEIDKVKPSCKCTTLKWTEGKIPPGGTGEVYAEIDTEDKTGEQTKFFAVIYNGNPPIEHVKMVFKVVGEVEKKEDEKAEGDGDGL